MITLTKLTRRSEESAILDELKKQVTAYNEIISQWNEFVKTTQRGREITLKEVRDYTRYASTKTDLVDYCQMVNNDGIHLENKLQHAKDIFAYTQTQEGKDEIAHLTESLARESESYKSARKDILDRANAIVAEILGKDFVIRHIGGYRMTINHVTNGERNFGEDIDISYLDWWDNKGRDFQVSVSTSGAFSMNTTMAQRYIAIGILLQRTDLQDALKDAISEQEGLDHRNYNEVHSQQQRLDELTFKK